MSMLIGHRAITRQFKELLKEGTLAHGYLLFGPRGAGKSSFALALAHYFEHGVFPGEHDAPAAPFLDALLIAPDASGSIGIDAVRPIRNFLRQMPAVSRYRTVIIADGERLGREAEHALLKVTEEPSSHALIFITLPHPDLLLPTLRSRFQKLYVPPASVAEVETWLMETHGVAKKDASRAALRAQGAPGIAWKLLFDEEFKALIDAADRFVSGGSTRTALVKELAAEETFDVNRFLDALMIALHPVSASRAPFWHRLLELRERSGYLNLNPRLQLTALGALLS